MTPRPRPYILAENNWKFIKDFKYEVAVLPWGATEAHNFHLPYNTDVAQCDFVAAGAAKIAWEQGAKVIVLPTIPFGVNTGQMDITLDINMHPSTQQLVLRDIVQSLSGQGIKKLLLMNGHGGNDFRQMIREIQVDYPDMLIFAMHWFKVVDDKPYFDDPGDHAGEMETSAMLHIAPQLVLPLGEAGDGKGKQLKLAAYKEGWVWAQRQWSKTTKDTGVGNPSQATAAKGKAYLESVCKKIAGFLAELSDADVNDIYDND